jgi:hypothetical protein
MKKLNIKLTTFSIVFIFTVQSAFSGTEYDEKSISEITSSNNTKNHSSAFKRIEELKNENQNDRRTPTPEQKEKNPDSPIPENSSSTPDSKEAIRTPTPTLEVLKPVLEEQEAQATKAELTVEQLEKELQEAILTFEKEKEEAESLRSTMRNLEDSIKNKESEAASKALNRVRTKVAKKKDEEAKQKEIDKKLYRFKKKPVIHSFDLSKLLEEWQEFAYAREFEGMEKIKDRYDELNQKLAGFSNLLLKEKRKSEIAFLEFEKLVLKTKTSELTEDFLAGHFMSSGTSPRQSAVQFLTLAAQLVPRHLKTVREFPNSTTKYKALLNIVEDIKFEASEKGQFLMGFLLEVRALANNYWSTNFSPAVFNPGESVFDASPMTQLQSNYDAITAVKGQLSAILFPAGTATGKISRKVPFIPKANTRILSSQEIVRSINEN